MGRQTYAEILSRLGGLNLDELTMLQKRIGKMIDAEAAQDGPRFKKHDKRHVEIKRIKKTLKDGTVKVYEYEYYRWWENGKLKSEYKGKAKSKPAPIKKAA